MSIKVYPETGYNSFISEDDADTYLESRLHASAWDAAADKEAALMTAYRSLQELDIVVDLSDATALQALATAQCEQALHEIRHDLDEPQASALSFGGLLSVKLKNDGQKPPRFSPRAIAMLRPYLKAPVISRTR